MKVLNPCQRCVSSEFFSPAATCQREVARDSTSEAPLPSQTHHHRADTLRSTPHQPRRRWLCWPHLRRTHTHPPPFPTPLSPTPFSFADPCRPLGCFRLARAGAVAAAAAVRVGTAAGRRLREILFYVIPQEVAERMLRRAREKETERQTERDGGAAEEQAARE